MNIYYTKPIEASCGSFNPQLSRTYNEVYAAMLRGETLPLESDGIIYTLNQDYVHVRTQLFSTGHKTLDPLSVPLELIAHLSDVITQAHINRPDINYEEAYSQFRIPKRTGGYRTIDAPSEELKAVQRNLMYALTYRLGLHAHEAAHAYTKGRSPKTSLAVHQASQSKWFMKLDIKDFFPSCATEFVHQQLDQLYPLCYFGPGSLEQLLKPCFLHGALPQGAITSPLLSNLVMLPIDFEMRKLREEFHQTFTYTRYADDILISSEYTFDFHKVEQYVAETIFHGTPFVIKHEKTRYGSIAGQNWNLGLMLNKDNAITVGSKRKVELKNSIFNLLTDFKKGIAWTPEDKLHLRGVYSYVHSIEPAYAEGVLAFYEQKIGVSWKDAIKIL